MAIGQVMPDHWRRLPAELQLAIRGAIEEDDHAALVGLVDVARDVLVAQKQNRKPSG